MSSTCYHRFDRTLEFNLGALCVYLGMLAAIGCKPTSDRPADRPAVAKSIPVPQKEVASPFAMNLTIQSPPPQDQQVQSNIRLTDVARKSGVEHRFQNGANGRVMIVETVGAGVGWLDFDNDGHWDLIANQGGDPTEMLGHQPLDQIFHNLDGTFRAVAEWARFVEPNYSQAVAVGDFDNDGFDDFYISNLLANTLWHNCGDGTFLEVGVQAGVADERWSCSSAWGDLDLDGDLDLYVCNYVKFDPHHAVACRDAQGRNTLCNIATYEPLPDACYFNQGDGTFIDQSRERGLFGPGNRALGVVICDFERDGRPDIYVANDTTPNFLFVNMGNAYFEDRARILGCDVDRAGAPQASMGVGLGDFDRNGFQDLYCTNFFDESNTLYANFGPNGFQDLTAVMGLHQPTIAFLGFGTVMQDLDCDGMLDIFVANGPVDSSPSNADNHKMYSQLFVQLAKKFWSVGPTAGDYFLEKRIGRGVATADYDGDGDLDLAVLNQNDLLALLRNDSKCGHEITVSFRGHRTNRRGIGCRVTVKAGDATFTQELCGGTSYASSHQPKLFFGLGEFDGKVDLTVEWPSGVTQTLSSVPIGKELVCEEPE